MKKLSTCILATTMVVSLVPSMAFASGEVSAVAKIIGGKPILSGTEPIVKDVELQLTITNASYLSNTTSEEHEFTISLEDATFNADTKDEFEDLILTSKLENKDTITKTVTDFSDDSFTFVLEGGLLAVDDIIAIDLDSTLDNNSAGSTAMIYIESDVITVDNLSLTGVAEKGFSIAFTKPVKLVIGERVKLDDKAVKVEPKVDGSYDTGTNFKLELSKGFEFVDGTKVTARDKNNIVKYATVKDGKLSIESPSTEPFYIEGLVIEATTAKVGDAATLKLSSQGLSATTTSDSSDKEEAKDEVKDETDKEEVKDETDKEEIKDPEVTDKEEIVVPKLVISIGADYMMSGEEKITLDAPAYISKEEYTMLPVKAVSSALSETGTVDWNGETKTVTITLGDRVVVMTVGESFYYVNGGEKIASLGSLEIVEGRTFLPIRDLGNALNITDIVWDAGTKTATLNGGTK